MSCLPGMPCYDVFIRTLFTEECNPCSTFIINSNKVEYTGANLPYTGINTGDKIQLALQKIDSTLVSEELIAQILSVIQNNTALKTTLCSIISDC